MRRPRARAPRRRVRGRGARAPALTLALALTLTLTLTLALTLTPDPNQVPEVLPVLLERLRNEITRVTTVRTFQQLASARMDMQLGPVLQPVVAELCSFLRKASRPLRQASLQALDTLVLNHAAQLGPADIGAVLAARG